MRNMQQITEDRQVYSILGIDLSLNATGVVFKDRAGNIECKETNFDSSIAIQVKWKSTVDLIISYANDSDIIVIEDYAFGAFGQSKSSLYEIGGIVRYELLKNGFDYFAIPPTSLKKFVTGKGNAPKAVMLKEVYKRWHFDSDSDNIADAFSLVKLAETALDLTIIDKDTLLILKKTNIVDWIERRKNFIERKKKVLESDSASVSYR